MNNKVILFLFSFVLIFFNISYLTSQESQVKDKKKAGAKCPGQEFALLYARLLDLNPDGLRLWATRYHYSKEAIFKSRLSS